MIHQRKILKAIAYAILLCFTSLTGAHPLYAIPANTQLPTGPNGTVGKPEIMAGVVQDNISGNTLTLTQNGTTSVLKWGNFSIGADAAVNFKGPDGFNSLNYVTGANAPISEIYGQLTALGGNIFIANPAGVQIGNSAQINVGSLYVTNKDVGEAVEYLDKNSKTDKIVSAIREHGVAETNAELMSLGAIVNAKNVTFDGARIVLDTDRIYTANKTTGELEQVNGDWFETGLDIITTDKDNVVLGYTKGRDGIYFDNFSIISNGQTDTLEHGYMWVHDLVELQAMNDDTNGWYALRNSIDANARSSFTPIGNYDMETGPFTGRFDGLGYSIFGLKVNVTDESDAAGLFGVTNGAHIKNFTLNGGTITGGEYVGAAVGSAIGGVIENITNTASVSGIGTGEGGIGGIVGRAGDTTMSGLKNIGTIKGDANSENVGGIVGNMQSGSLTGETYNLGSVTGGWNIGGIAGQMTNGAKIGNDGDDAFQIYNQLNVEGKYNVGGIAGTLTGGTITNAANHGNITATGKTVDTYSYHTAVKGEDNIPGHDDPDIFVKLEEHDKDNNVESNLATVYVDAANVGGIVGKADGSADGKKATIEDVLNDGDVTSTRVENDDSHYIAGNVGGIVGRAENTDITNAENKENTVAGAHNVGGVAGFLGGDSTVDTGVNNGGDITATGARRGNSYVKERIRPYSPEEDEAFNVGNIGGIVGYLFGDKAKVKNSGNRGTVHSANIDNVNNVPDTAKAANVGGVVGKIDTPEATTLDKIKNYAQNGYADGQPTVLNSYSTGNVRGYTGVGGVVGMMYNGSVAGSYNLGTVQSSRAVSGGREPLNMGGVVGDTTEDTKANAVIYDVYNAGTIGDDDYEYYGRHVGGVVGRLSGTVEKAYNTGDIYNGYSTVGGIAGWWYSGNMTNVFNTGNITVRVDSSEENARTAGSQVGGIAGASSNEGHAKALTNAYNLGTIRSFAVTNSGYDTTLNSVGGIIGNVQGTDVTSITNVYTTNNLYAATANGVTEGASYEANSDGLGAIYGTGDPNNVKNAYYVKMYGSDSGFVEPGTQNVTTLTPSADDPLTDENFAGFTFFNQIDAGLNTAAPNFEDSWRIYNGTMPILNAFLPDAEGYLSDANLGSLNIDSVQYGTAANPLLTIINANSDVTLDWGNLNSSGNASFAVYGGGLTLENFGTETGYYRGTIYADGALNITGVSDKNFNLGSSANLYGTSVKLDAKDGDATIYGNVTSTNGGISIKGDDVEIIGKLAASKAGDEAVSVKNIAKQMPSRTGSVDGLDDPKASVPTVSDAYAHKANNGNVATETGSITVNASGAAEVLYGNLGTGSVSTAGNFTVNGGTTDGGSVYVDSDLSGTTGNINLSAGGEVLLDITNIAKANSNEQGSNGWDKLHKFLEDHGGDKIILDSKNDDEVLAIDMWNGSKFDLKQYDEKGTENTFDKAIRGLGDLASKTHIWISDADQLKGIQEYAENPLFPDTQILTYNFALKGNIDASALTDYKEIGGDDGFSGTFDGRDFRIIGLNADATKADEASSGIFGKLAGTVKDLRVYASKFFGDDNESAGAIASEVTEGGKITGVTTFGNRVEAANAGGIAGTNAGKIESSAASDSVITNGGTAGGIAGTNTGTIGAMEGTFVTAESAVTSNGNATAIGGVVGDNKGTVNLANSLGVTNGANVDKNIGGIAGVNSGTMYSLYNESVVTGNGSVGGVAGTNSGNITNAVNTTGITATGDYAGGLAGVNSGTIDSGRNTGTINGKDNVGGMVGKNEEKADGTGGILKNLSNAVTAAIFGSANVGGIAGTNSGTITSDNNLVNEGTVYGNQYVGGIAGENTGTIENVLNETLVLKTEDGTNAMYFGGIAGTNSGRITNATNNSNVSADGATFVGGIVGENTLSGELEGKLINYGDVSGESNVGGLAGSNANDDLLKGTENDYITAENHGEVKADAGSAGGIFYENKGDIEYANLTNTGTVIGTGQANTGGLFGINNGDISNSKLTNSGTVTGGDNTGGLIGSNSGNVSNSSLINIVGAKVTGGDNTGGLIGKNTGTIKGGRGEGKDGMTMYTDKIYNNGAVSGASNVGGLIGNNAQENGKTGSLYAAYNTGTVSGTGNNVGGIVGTNAGTVSSVFNTIMTATGENQSVTGASNVGGIIGYNTGALKDAYNTTGVSGGGNAVGTNTGTIRNVYATNTTGRLINNNSGTVSNVYTFAADDGSARFVSEAERMFSRFYSGFGFGSAWKNYDGWSTPMLKVFLTQAGYSADTELVQTGYPMSLPIKGNVVAGDNLIAYDNANALLVALANTELGEDYLAFYSTQIAASGEGALFNPNNLGYDIDVRYSIVPLFEHNTGYLHWLHRGGDRERNFRERKAEIYFHEGGMVHEETL